MAEDGICQKWIVGRGFGFIEFGKDETVFVHCRELKNDRRILEEGEKVTFDIGRDEQKGDPNRKLFL